MPWSSSRNASGGLAIGLHRVCGTGNPASASQGPFPIASPFPGHHLQRLMTIRSSLLLLPLALACLVLSSCSAHLSAGKRPPCAAPSSVGAPTLQESAFTSFDGNRFPYSKWLPLDDSPPSVVVVGFHGIAGASTDLSILGKHLQEHDSSVAVYAPDLRGQGNDPVPSRRGDIQDRRDWFSDFRTFTRLVRQQHPKARIVWCGESMGSLIALHAVATSSSNRNPPCDALILSSPIAHIHDDFPQWKRTALRWGARLFPWWKISLESLSAQDDVRVVRDVVHREQAQTNSYHVPAFTFRLLYTLGNMIESLPAQANRVGLPVLILHGGHDIFSRPEDVKAFSRQFAPTARITRHFYPQSYHLLFYDHSHKQVLTDITCWIGSLDKP